MRVPRSDLMVKRRKTKPLLPRRPHAWRPAPDVGLLQRMVDRMQPGAWYARPDLAKLTGGRRKSIDFIVAWARGRGLVEQGEDPDWSEHVFPRGVPFRPAVRAPRYLFRLTAAGIARRSRAQVLD